VGKRERLAGNRGIGSVDQDPLVVDDLDNDGNLALGGTVVDEDDTADLDEAVETRQPSAFDLSNAATERS